MNVLFLLLFVPAAALTALRAPDEFLPALLAGAGKAVTLCLTLAAVYAVWMGFCAWRRTRGWCAASRGGYGR